ncbi:DUF4265 domain-containing protein [Pelomonas parva]|uniref:DUF4265 domain-containing protein n=1 Tax=Pelomonas parva TaxID=3299032 RepID=A0ABW7F634_9BURK
MEMLLFALDVDDGWPPVAAEGVWCERDGDLYSLKNVPLFIRGLAVGDVFRAQHDPVNGQIFEFELVKSSGHSLVRVLNNDSLDFSLPEKRLLEMGCSLATFEKFSMFAIDVPAEVGRDEINAIVDSLEEEGFALAFPVWRHEPA